MYVATIKNRNSPPAILLRESYREDGKVKNRTLANLTALPPHAIDALRQSLKGVTLVPQEESTLHISRSAHHGHVQAVLEAMRQLGMAELIHTRNSKSRDCVLAMIAARVLQPDTKLATTRWWHNTTLPSLLNVEDCDEDDLYQAMDWLLKQQNRIEKKLAKRHLQNNALALYDLSSSYVEGSTCPLAAYGYNRDGKKGKQQINYGLLTNASGIPVGVSVFEGNVNDTKTLLSQVNKLRDQFDRTQFVLVGDRGMITQTQIDQLKQFEGVDWIGALRPGPIRKLLQNNAIQMDLFDETNLFSFIHPDFPGERLIACRNPAMAERRKQKRQALQQATNTELDKVSAMVNQGRLSGQDKIGVRVGKVLSKYKVAKHYQLDIGDNHFSYEIDQQVVDTEAALDGLYVVRTSLDEEQLDDHDTVRSYKSLSQVEGAFRSLKSIDLQVRPIHHRLENRVRAHVLLCMLAFYVHKHMTEAWRPILFADEDQQAKATRDPIAPAKRSKKAINKVQNRLLEDGTEVHSFRTLLAELSSIVRNTCHVGNDAEVPFELYTSPNAKQQHALDLLKHITL